MHGHDPETLLRDVTWLRQLARRLVADDASADDLAGDTLATWCAAPAPPHNRRGWLATVLRHRAARQHRRDALRRRTERAAVRDEHLPALDDTLAKAQLHRAVVEAVLSLAEPYRSAVLLRHLDELPLHEVAARLQVPSETARTRIKRGLEQLRRRLDQRYGDRAAWAAMLLPWRPSLQPIPLLGLLMTTKFAVTAAVAAAVVYLLLPHEPLPSPSPLPIAATATPAAAAVAAQPEAASQRQPAVASSSPQPTSATTSVPSILVRGRVVDEASSLPLAGVTVGWFGRDSATTTSDRDGRFAWRTPLPTHRAVLLLREREHALCTKALGEPVDARTPDVFDVGDVTMPPGTALAGTVVDNGGAPAAGAALFALLCSYHTSAGRMVRLEEALPVGCGDAAGSFRLDDRLMPNRPAPLLLAACARGVGYCDLDALRRERSSVRVEIRLLPATTLRVRVVDEHGVAVAGARVVAEPRFLPLGAPGTWPILVERVPGLAGCFTAASGADGIAALEPLAVLAGQPTPYTLRVEAAGRDPAIVPVRLPQPDPIDVLCATARPLQLHGHVRDGAGRPIASASVRAHWDVDASADSGSDGAFSLSLRRGTGPLVVAVEADGWTAQRRELQPDAGAEGAACDFVLQPVSVLSGRVQDQHGEPVAGALVWLAGGDDRATPSAADGTFRMPLPPGPGHILSISPPEPASSWRGRIDHAVRPGQDSVTLVLTRLPRDRSELEVDVIDAAGRPLEPGRVRLERGDGALGIQHPATGVIGRVTAGGLAPGDWSLRIVPMRGCELLRHFTVPPGGAAVHLQLVQPTGSSAQGELVPEAGGELPARIDLRFAAGDQQARFVAAAGQQLLDHGRLLRLDPRHGLGFAIVDVDPSRPLAITADGGDLRGQVTAHPTPGGETTLRLPLRRAATLRLSSRRPFVGDRLLLQLRRPQGPWGDAMHCEGLRGRTDLIDLPITAGGVEWRVLLPSAGADNRIGPAWQSGACTVAPGGIAVAEVVEPH